MKVNFRKIGFIATVAACSILGAVKYTSTAEKNLDSTKNCVKVLNPNRYNEIMETGKQNDTKIWMQAVEEITDSLRKLNSDAERGYFRANQMLKDTTKTTLKSLK